MTEEEQIVVAQLAGAWNAFLALPIQHADDIPEFRRIIHAAQEKVLARPAIRELRDQGG